MVIYSLLLKRPPKFQDHSSYKNPRRVLIAASQTKVLQAKDMFLKQREETDRVSYKALDSMILIISANLKLLIS